MSDFLDDHVKVVHVDIPSPRPRVYPVCDFWRRGMTHSNVARRLGMSREHLVHLVYGKAKPSRPLAIAIGVVLNAPDPEAFADEWIGD